ncbi:MAG: hypothetical protein ABS46_12925 [Cytophagaceae bacterium SCN 52-12]|nr:MAG: hypothetical protein ABS46_12925 [Cytophagaceae bacterium SCN 52-12]
MKPTLSKDMLFSYFSGRATSLQKTLIEEWLGEAGSSELYYEWLEEWERSQPHFLPDTDRAWKKNKERINGSATEEIPAKIVKTPAGTFRAWLYHHAVWKTALCLIVTGIIFYGFRDFILYRQYSTAYGELRTVTLEDNSLVVLNANSELRVPRLGFGLRHREVFLKGEAEFVVSKTADSKKFTVHTPDRSRITVLGTEFVVYTRARGTRIVLNKGKVKLTSPDVSQSSVTLSPGDRASISAGKIKLEKLTAEQLDAQSTWKEHRFVFDRTPLPEVGIRLNEIFGVQITIADSLLSGKELTGSYKAQTLDEFLEVLSDMLDIRIARKNNEVLLFSK